MGQSQDLLLATIVLKRTKPPAAKTGQTFQGNIPFANLTNRDTNLEGTIDDNMSSVTASFLVLLNKHP